ncbi:MAG: formylglycine-generating enzyme family protein [Myxococcales bacterium]|nr:formylglycine-generating enzyme family protein [Myxococcales bacterium]
MRWIPRGSFIMGSPPDEPGRWDDEGPAHEVEITRGFWLGDTPVTQGLWEAVMGANPSRFKDPRRPVETVSWEECQAFCAALERLAPGLGVRLPSEAEWEYACRAGTETATYAGAIKILGERYAPVLDAIAWYGGNSGVGYDLGEAADSTGWQNKQHEHSRAGTRRVGQKQGNPWGLHDMLGNVYEWCSDAWHSYSSAGSSQQDPLHAGSTGDLRVARGGGWRSYARLVRAAYRFRDPPGVCGDDLGLRLARDQEPAK